MLRHKEARRTAHAACDAHDAHAAHDARVARVACDARNTHVACVALIALNAAVPAAAKLQKEAPAGMRSKPLDLTLCTLQR